MGYAEIQEPQQAETTRHLLYRKDSKEATKAIHTLGTRNVGSDYLMGAV